MPVSYHAIIRQMKKELEEVDSSASQQHVLSKMHVIKSLADVVINSYEETSESISQSKSEQPQMSEAEARMMGISQSPSKKTTKRESRLEEDDANGDSIFDF
ncbi:DUF5327 family protein [Tenuibacillus multivorans]|uniref:YwdI family protein n=1 Tax=Tenuibacillus multivorans TaxID=237069 RepID=A0A1G9WY89_9BACI|nr:DUF5327 family protein [Tenuibacillus multivorans]GEL77316.1 hypothetical protein TMU01_15510 [Tenuibacillus multivorans]SDM89073.1 hypothetical protein SAMN05216498_0925 [Tenuibacillus multivorans]